MESSCGGQLCPQSRSVLEIGFKAGCFCETSLYLFLCAHLPLLSRIGMCPNFTDMRHRSGITLTQNQPPSSVTQNLLIRAPTATCPTYWKQLISWTCTMVWRMASCVCPEKWNVVQNLKLFSSAIAFKTLILKPSRFWVTLVPLEWLWPLLACLHRPSGMCFCVWQQGDGVGCFVYCGLCSGASIHCTCLSGAQSNWDLGAKKTIVHSSSVSEQNVQPYQCF